MLVLIPGFIEDSVNFQIKATSLKMFSLLSNEIYMAGNLHTVFEVESEFRKFNMEQRVNFIVQFDADLPQGVGKEFTETIGAYKILKKRKNKTKNEVVMLVKIEKAVDVYFDIILKEMMIPFDKPTIVGLKPFFDKDTIHTFLIPYEQPETSFRNTNKLSEMLLFRLEEEDLQKNPILFLEYPFFNPLFYEAHKHEPVNETYSSNGFLLPFLNICNYNFFSLQDVELLQEELQPILKPLQQHCFNFAALKNSPKDAHQYILQHITPAGIAFDNAMQQHPLIQTMLKFDGFKNHAAQLYIGMLPWQTIIDYYEFINIVNEPTLNVLKSQTPPGHLIPVLVFKPKDNNLYRMEEIQTQPEQTAPEIVRKKYLDID
jgi:hypothetical protein